MYNILNLPSKIVAGPQEITYIYSARGDKLASVTGSSSTYYRGVMVYSRSGSQSEQLVHILHPQGFTAREGNAYIYKYFNYHHTGNVAIVFSVRNNGTSLYTQVEQSNFYHSSGYLLEMSNLHLNRYLTTGKELQDAVGIGYGIYDYGARHYMSLIGRWTSPDPALQGLNPFVYCGNNPAMYVDPDGRWCFIPLLASVAQAGLAGLAAWDMGGRQGSGIEAVVKNAMVAGVAGLAGVGVSGLIGSAFNGAAVTAGQSMARGAATGAAGGFASGFVGGAGAAWINGASFGEGLGAGLLGGGIGAAAGGILGGIAGYGAYSQVRNDFLEAYPNVSLSTPLEKSNETLYAFSDKYFSDYIYKDRADLVYDGSLKTLGRTGPELQPSGNYLIRFGDRAFVHEFTMYMTMGHEYIHVAQYINIPAATSRAAALLAQNYREVAAYEWNIRASKGTPTTAVGTYSKGQMKYLNAVGITREGISGHVPAMYMNYESWGLHMSVPFNILP